jgi:type 2 lantibiotic biosynthesis protein LanM
MLRKSWKVFSKCIIFWLNTEDSPFKKLAHQQVRFVFRATRVYASLLNNTLQPRYLRDGIDRSIQLDALSRALLLSDSASLFRPLLREELQALEQMDIPYFSACANSDSLSINSTQILNNCFKEPSYSTIISRLHKLSDQDLKQQVAIIKTSLYTHIADKLKYISLSDNLYRDIPNTSTITALSQKELLEQAIAIANELQNQAIRSDDGSTTWIGLEYMPDAQKFQLKPLGYGLYDGSCGVALFLSALEKITGAKQGFENLAFEALLPVSKILQNKDPIFQRQISKQLGIGAGMGLGSIIYALAKISQFTKKSTLLEAALLAASMLTTECIISDQNLDIISGAAGAILGLLTLYETTLDPLVLQKAIACGHHLLNNRTTTRSGYKTWSTLGGKLMTGFSHGVAGIAYSLLRLYKITQESLFFEAAKEAISYERSVFSSEARNCADFKGDKVYFINSWCHGDPGIALARLGSLSVLDTYEIQQDIEIALKTTQKVSLQRVDRLCCGNFGIIEILLVAASQLSRPDLFQNAQKKASWVLSRAKQADCFYLFSNLERDIYNPGFFTGTAGIGYELLRLAYPDVIPSVLLWQ